VSGPTVVTCARAPPQIGGTGTVMYELLGHFPKESIVLIMRAQRAGISRDDRVLDVKTFEVGSATSATYKSAFRMAMIPLLIISMLRRIRSLEKPPRNMLAVHPDLDFLVASIIVSKILVLPISVYLHDTIVEAATGLADRWPARFAERFVFARARKVYSMSVPMTEYYRGLGRETETLPHGVNPELMRAPSLEACSAKPKVGFAGVVYNTNGSALRDLVSAKEASKDSFQIHITTSAQSIPYLRQLGILDKLDSVQTLRIHSEVLDFLAGCDVLFVPMSFESQNYKDLLTIFPTKVTDYWLAQRPIIVYGPREYAFVSLAEQDGYAKVVSERSPEAIAKAISDLCADAGLRKRLVSASRKMARIHDGNAVASKLIADLGIVREGV